MLIRWQAIILNIDVLVHWCIYASNFNIYLHFTPFLHTEIVQTIEIFSHWSYHVNTMAVDNLVTRGTDIYAHVYLHKHLHVCLTYISTDRCIYTHYTFDCDDEVMTWRCYLHYWPFVRGIHWYPVDSPHKGTGTWWIPLTKGQSSRDLKFSILLAWIIFLINSPVVDGHHCNAAFFL